MAVRSNSPFVTYSFRVVLFGATSSPFMLHTALTFHLTQNITLVSQDLLHNLYVDNIVSRCSIEQAAVEYFTKSRSPLTKAGFNLRSWSSICTQLQSVLHNTRLQNQTIQSRYLEYSGTLRQIKFILHLVQIQLFHLLPLSERSCDGPQAYFTHWDSYHQLQFLQKFSYSSCGRNLLVETLY